MHYASTRRSGTFGRDAGRRGGALGGEEFTLLLPRCPAGSAQGAAERLRAAIAAIRISSARPTCASAPASAITAVAEPHAGVDGREMIGRADEALYTAKKAGRDRVCFLPGVGAARWRPRYTHVPWLP